MTYQNKIVVVLLLASIRLFSTAYSSTDSFINVPIAKAYDANEIQFGLLTGYSGSSSIQDESSQYEYDIKGVYSFD